MKRISALVGLMVLALGLTASASTITINSTTGQWTSVTVPSGTESYVTGVGTNEIHWGEPAGSQKSGLRFDGSQPPVLGVDPGSIFQLGTLTHYNQPTYSGTAASGADLSISLDTSAGTQNFAFSFGVDETINAAPCPYYSVTPCSDAIFLPTSFSASTLTVGGVDYHLQILGFGADASHIDSMFISQENSNNSTNLWATLTETPMSTVPEPASMSLLAGGLVGLAGLRKKFRK